MKSKINIFLALCLAFTSSQSIAQMRVEPFYPYSKFTVGVGAGISSVYGDFATFKAQPVYKVNVARNVNEWVNLNLDVTHGELNAIVKKKSWTTGLSSVNAFTSASINGNVALGELFNTAHNMLEKTIYGIYFGAGVGYMNNNITSITTKFKETDKFAITYNYPGSIKGNSNTLFIPLNAGINLHITRVVMINANYQFCYTFSDFVDGYNFKNVKTNKFNDSYSVLTLGLQFYLGSTSMTPNRD